MTRNGKIARLPRKLRDEVNHRLDNGEPGVRILQWLNALPQVEKMLAAEFEGSEINEVNLTDWKNGGYLEWKEQQQMLELVREFKSDSKQLAVTSGLELTECLAVAVGARYAALLQDWDAAKPDELQQRLKALRTFSREIARLRRGERDMERVQLEQRWLELGREKTEAAMAKRWEEICRKGQDYKYRPEYVKGPKIRSIRELLFLREDQKDPAPTPKKKKKKGEEKKKDEQKDSPESNDTEKTP